MKKINYYELTLKYFRKILKYNKNITEEEWDKYAHQNNLFSSLTLKAKEDVDTFEELKARHRWF